MPAARRNVDTAVTPTGEKAESPAAVAVASPSGPQRTSVAQREA